MLVGSDNGGVDKQLFKVSVSRKFAGHAFPDARVTPSREAHVCAVPIAKFSGKIPSRNPRTHDPKYRLDEKSIVLGRTARISCFARQQVLNTVPLVIS